VRWIVLLIAHGTVEDSADLPAFLNEIRRGRPAPPELVEELKERYAAVGGSPLLRLTQAQARAVEKTTGLETRVAMRLWDPRVPDVLADIEKNARVCVVPLAPFSVDVYAQAALQSLSSDPDKRARVHSVQAWGEEPALIEAYVEAIRAKLDPVSGSDTRIILTAHSLPLRAIQSGDQYEIQFRRTAELVSAALGVETHVCFQSQGAMAGAWLGPELLPTMAECAKEGAKRVVVAPIGFLSEHIETLYDLDIEAKGQATELGLEMVRVPALNSAPGLIEAIACAVRKTISEHSEAANAEI